MEEDEALEWENENGGNMTWILDKGWAVGKKMLITGVVISSAPVILPPLMFISTLGLVCAVPCGFFLASYACAEKLVAKLLPSPKALTYEEMRAKDEGFEEYGGDSDVANEEEELDMRLEQDEKENCEKNGYTDDVLDEEDKTRTEEMPGVMVVIEEEDENGNVKEEVTVDVTDVAVELCERDDSEDNEELVKETTGLLEKIRDEGLSSEGSNKNEEGNFEQRSGKGDGGKINESEASHVKQNRETVTQSKGTKANNAKKNRKAKTVDARETADEISGIDLVDEKRKAPPDSATPAGNNKPGVNDIGYLEVTVPSNVSSPGSGGIASKEAPYSEEKIWKQIDAMRAIVGYTATRLTTCIDELKALYVFTGVEPPASFNDPSDLVEISSKLRFLMSVVGVK